MVLVHKGAMKIFLSVFLGAFLGGLLIYLSTPSAVLPSLLTTSLDYSAEVCVYKTSWLGDHYGERELVECSHNVLYNQGQNMTRDALSGVGGNQTLMRRIILCNATAGCAAPNAGATETFNALSFCGLAPAEGSYATVPTSAGNWSIYTTFTSSCAGTTEINATRLANISNASFAGNTFTLVSLSNNDQLTVNWTISVV